MAMQIWGFPRAPGVPGALLWQSTMSADQHARFMQALHCLKSITQSMVAYSLNAIMACY
jgi:hypothetical protein